MLIMRIWKSHPLFSLYNGYLIDCPGATNISNLWSIGSLLGFCLIIQIITGVTLAMHYNPSVSEAFNSVEHIMRDVNNGWLTCYISCNIVSILFLAVYTYPLHAFVIMRAIFVNKIFGNFIIGIVLLLVFVYFSATPHMLDSFVENMDNGTIVRTPFTLVQGQTIRNLGPEWHGWHIVTGGQIFLGPSGNGQFTRILGILVDGHPIVSPWHYFQGNQPFNFNFATVLYELRTLGQNNISNSCLNHYYMNNGNVSMFSDYFSEFKAAYHGEIKNDFGNTVLNSKMLNALAERKS